MVFNEIGKYLRNHGIYKIARQNGKILYLMILLELEVVFRIRFIAEKFLMVENGLKRFIVQEMEYRQLKKDDYLLVECCMKLSYQKKCGNKYRSKWRCRQKV